jgi:hypothetical protein
LEDGETYESVLYCSTSGWAFGPIFPSREAAELFLAIYDGDPRSLTEAELSSRFAEFTMYWVCECGTVRDEDADAPEPGDRFKCSWCVEKHAKARHLHYRPDSGGGAA